MTTTSTEMTPGQMAGVWRRLALALLVSTAAIDPAWAQDAGGTWLDTITVIGTRTEMTVKDNPRSVAVITSEEIERRAPESIAAMLRDVPGVEVADESIAGMKRLRIRGESSRRVTILVDGQEITDHSTFGTPILVDPATVERIEVLKGPSSVLYGAKAIGGVVNIITKKGADKPLQVEAGGSFNSGAKGWQGWTAVAGSTNGLDYRLSGMRNDYGNRVVPEGRYSSTGELEGTSFSNDNLYAHLGYRFGEADNHYIAVKAEQHRLESESWPGVDMSPLIQNFKIDLPQRDRRKIGLYYDGDEISEVVRRVHFDLYYQTIDRLFKNDILTAVGPARTVDVTSTSDDRIVDYGANAQVDLDLWEGHQTIVGAQYLSDKLDTKKSSTTTMTGFAPFPITTSSQSRDEAHIDNYSLYAQDEWSLSDELRLTSGLRLIHVRTDLDDTTVAARAGFKGTNDTRLLSSLGLTWEPIGSLVLRTSYSEGYISPTLLQLFSTSTAGGQTIYGNPELDPELSRNVEVGARYEGSGWALDGAAFYSRARDYIATTRCVSVTEFCQSTGTPSSTTSIYVNADRATTYGMELLAEYTYGDTGITPYVSGTWIRRELEFATFSTHNTDTPALSGRIGVKYEDEWQDVPFWTDLFVRGSVATKQTYFEGGDLVTDELPGWGTLNFAAGANFGEDQRFSVSMHLNNLLNKEYRPTFGELPGVGRSIELAAQVKF